MGYTKEKSCELFYNYLAQHSISEEEARSLILRINREVARDESGAYKKVKVIYEQDIDTTPSIYARGILNDVLEYYKCTREGGKPSFVMNGTIKVTGMSGTLIKNKTEIDTHLAKILGEKIEEDDKSTEILKRVKKAIESLGEPQFTEYVIPLIDARMVKGVLRHTKEETVEKWLYKGVLFYYGQYWVKKLHQIEEANKIDLIAFAYNAEKTHMFKDKDRKKPYRGGFLWTETAHSGVLFNPIEVIKHDEDVLGIYTDFLDKITFQDTNYINMYNAQFLKEQVQLYNKRLNEYNKVLYKNSLKIEGV